MLQLSPAPDCCGFCVLATVAPLLALDAHTNDNNKVAKGAWQWARRNNLSTCRLNDATASPMLHLTVHYTLATPTAHRQSRYTLCVCFFSLPLSTPFSLFLSWRRALSAYSMLNYFLN